MSDQFRHYEIVLLVHPDQSEQVALMLERYQGMVTAEDGRVHRTEDWGRRRLAYMIGEVHKAHYVLLNVECALATLRELEKNFKFNDSIIRALVIRRDRAMTEQSAMAKAKEAEDRLEAEKAAAQAVVDAEAKVEAAAAVVEAEAKVEPTAASVAEETAGGGSDGMDAASGEVTADGGAASGADADASDGVSLTDTSGDTGDGADTDTDTTTETTPKPETP